MKHPYFPWIALYLAAVACGGEIRSDKRQLKGVSLDVRAAKPVAFEFAIPDRSKLAAEVSDINETLTGYYYSVRGEGKSCPSSELHEGAGLYDDGRVIAFDLIGACNYLLTIKLGQFVEPAPTAALTQTVINFQDHIQPIIKTNCVSCHPAYDSYAGVKDAARSMVLAVEDEVMPPTAPLGGSDIALFLAWADGGYLENDPAPHIPSAAEKSIDKVYYRNNNNDFIQSYELLGRTKYELQRALWLQSDGEARGLQTKQLFTFYDGSL